MCETTKGPRELLGVSVVDADGKALLRTLVKPRGDILDLKTDITGIKPADLEGVTTTCHDVQVCSTACLPYIDEECKPIPVVRAS